MKLENLLITGGAGSTGFAIADRFAREGISVTLTSRDLTRAEKAAGLLCEKRGGEHIGLELDQSDERSVTALYDRLAEPGRLPDSIVLSAADLGMGMDPLE